MAFLFRRNFLRITSYYCNTCNHKMSISMVHTFSTEFECRKISMLLVTKCSMHNSVHDPCHQMCRKFSGTFVILVTESAGKFPAHFSDPCYQNVPEIFLVILVTECAGKFPAHFNAPCHKMHSAHFSDPYNYYYQNVLEIFRHICDPCHQMCRNISVALFPLHFCRTHVSYTFYSAPFSPSLL